MKESRTRLNWKNPTSTCIPPTTISQQTNAYLHSTKKKIYPTIFSISTKHQSINPSPIRRAQKYRVHLNQVSRAGLSFRSRTARSRLPATFDLARAPLPARELSLSYLSSLEACTAAAAIATTFPKLARIDLSAGRGIYTQPYVSRFVSRLG